MNKEPQIARYLQTGGQDDGQTATAMGVCPYLIEAVREDLGKKA